MDVKKIAKLHITILTLKNKKYMFTLAIVGKPNVGKSTIFNSLVKQKSALAYDIAGVTIDRKEEVVEFMDMKMRLVDTAGFEKSSEKILAKGIERQISYAVAEADLLLLVIDSKSGVLFDDLEFISYLRKQNKDIVLLVNKAEVKKKNITEENAKKLGFKDMVFLSAEHKLGYEILFEKIDKYYQIYQKDYQELEESSKDDKSIKITIVGKPNVGKSTLINAFLDNERLVTCDQSGTTRDAIEIKWKYKGKDITLVDTAGIRKRSKISHKLEELSYASSFKAIRFAQICILLLDASQKKLEKQDVHIASEIIREGRGLIVVLNKTDLLTRDELKKAVEEVEYQIGKYVPQNKELKIWTVSAKNKKNIWPVIDSSLDVYENWNVRINTRELNKWLEWTNREHRLPLYRGKDIKLKYITQISTRPPTFVIMTNYPEKIPDSYIRYLKNSINESFHLKGVIPRFIFKRQKNPFAKGREFKTEKK